MTATQERIHKAKGLETEFVLLKNADVQRKDMSYEAVGMLAYLMSLPADWSIYVHTLKRNGHAGRDKVRRILKELQDNGYVTITQPKNPDGTFGANEYHVYATPELNPEHQPSTENPSTGNPPLQSKEVQSKDEALDSTYQEPAPPVAGATSDAKSSDEYVTAHFNETTGKVEYQRVEQSITCLDDLQGTRRTVVEMLTRQWRLAGKFQWPYPTFRELIDRLVSDGLVEIKQNKQLDWLIRLTERGKQLTSPLPTDPKKAHDNYDCGVGLALAMGIKTKPRGSTLANYIKVAVDLEVSGIPRDEFSKYIKWMGQRSWDEVPDAGFRVTLNSLNTNGRPAIYVEKRERAKRNKPIRVVHSGDKPPERPSGNDRFVAPELIPPPLPGMSVEPRKDTES